MKCPKCLRGQMFSDYEGRCCLQCGYRDGAIPVLAPQDQPTQICWCGYEAKSAPGLRQHQARVHVDHPRPKAPATPPERPFVYGRGHR